MYAEMPGNAPFDCWLGAMSLWGVYWPFASGWLLAWSLAAAIPLLIHLLHRRVRREEPWAAMALLLAATARRDRRWRWEEFLLLAVRTLILLLFAAALAEPFMRSQGAVTEPPTTHWVLVLDGSLSMTAREGVSSRFENAKARAISLAADAPPGDAFSVVLMARRPRRVIRSPAFDLESVAEQLQLLAPTQNTAPLAPTLTAVIDTLDEAARVRDSLQQTRVVFLTDLGGATWGAEQLAASRKLLDILAERARSEIVVVGRPRANFAITNLRVRQSLEIVGRDAEVAAAVRAFGASGAAPQTVEFLVDGGVVGRREVNFGAADRATASWTHRFSSPGEHLVEARLADDALAIDNRRFRSTPINKSVRVLCLAGVAGAARFVALALDPSGQGEEGVEVTTRAAVDLSTLDLSQYGCVWLCNVARFDRGEAAALRDYARSGGVLVFVLGDRVLAENYNQRLGANSAGGPLLPATLGAMQPVERSGFDPLDYTHRLLTPFRGQRRGGELLTTPLWRRIELTPYENQAVGAVLAFRDGAAALVEHEVGDGRVLLLATAAEDISVDRSVEPPQPWSALAAWPSFPPLVQEMLAFGLRGLESDRNVLVSEPFGGAVAARFGATEFQVVDPWDQQASVRPQTTRISARWRFDATDRAGVYHAMLAPIGLGEQLFAVNVDSLESDLGAVEMQSLPTMFQPAEESGSAVASDETTGDHQIDLFRVLLGAVLALVMVETLMGWRMTAARGSLNAPASGA